MSVEVAGASASLFESSLETPESEAAPELESLLEPVSAEESLEPVEESDEPAPVEPEAAPSVLPAEFEDESPAAEPFESEPFESEPFETEPFEVDPSLVVPPAEPLLSASVEGASILSSLESSLELSFESGVGAGAGVDSGCTGSAGVEGAAAASSSAI